MRISYSKHFLKRFQKLSSKNQTRFKERLELFLKNSHNPLLKDPPLKGDWIGCRAFSVTGNFRAIYRVLGRDEIKFLDIGTHPQVY